MIYEVIITTVNAQGEPHIAPFGVRRGNGFVLISPYQPSTTLSNILATKTAVLNVTDDVRHFAAALTQKPQPALTKADKLNGFKMPNLLYHQELSLVDVLEDAQRPTLKMQVVFEVQHQPFLGFNRAQAAVIEACILVSRLHLLPPEKIKNEMAYLQIAIDKTADAHALEAWGWLQAKVADFYDKNKQ